MTIEIRPEKSQPNPTSTRESQYSLRSLFAITTGLCILLATLSFASRPWFPLALLLVVVVVPVGLVVSGVIRGPWLLLSVAAGWLLLAALLQPVLATWNYAAHDSQCRTNLQQISVALQNYHDVYKSFPPAYIADEQGKPLHSWRVLLLPFLEEMALYQRYRFDEPWDGPNNSQLHGEWARVYECPAQSYGMTKTNYLAVVGAETAWPGTRAATYDDLTDGTSITLHLVEVRNSGIHWMEPRDLDFGQMPFKPNAKTPGGISSWHVERQHCNAACCDGRILCLPNSARGGTIHALLTRSGGEDVQPLRDGW